GKVVLIHNGIIENYLTLRATLECRGRRMVSETDTEVISHLIDEYIRQGCRLADATRRAVAELQGSYAIVVLSEDEPDRLVTAQKGGHKHFLLKESHEQPQAIIDTIRGRILHEEGDVQLDADVRALLAAPIDRAVLIACGTAWHACLVRKFLLERLAHLSCEV